MLYFSLQKDLFQNESCPIDLEARVFTAETEDIIGQYIIFCRVMDDQVKILGRTQEAAIEAIRICCDRGVLKDYLKEREKEVITIMITLFNQEYATKQYGKAQKEEGRILEAVDIYRDEMNMDNEAIIKAIMKKFNLSRKTAEEYVIPSVSA